MMRVYLDHAATTTARAEAIDAMIPLLGARGGNPSSLHAEGRTARAALDRARDDVARVLGAKSREIVFTASGSESLALAIVGVARARRERGMHIVSSVIEHSAVLRTLEVLEGEGWSITRLPVDAQGRVDPAQFAAALRAETTLASIMLANNEIGTIQPIAELAAHARARGVVFHTDAVQAPGQLSLDVAALGVDVLSVSGHKFAGPRGVGALYVRSGTPLVPLVVGGGQEHGLRAGTENVAGIVGFATALGLADGERSVAVSRIAALRNRLEAAILATISDVYVNGTGAARLPSLASLSFGGVAADALLIRLDLEGIAASAGSACAAGSLEPSHVIAALGVPTTHARGVIRFSLGRTTTDAEIDRVVGIVPIIVTQVRGSAALV